MHKLNTGNDLCSHCGPEEQIVTPICGKIKNKNNGRNILHRQEPSNSNRRQIKNTTWYKTNAAQIGTQKQHREVERLETLS